jgi:hypothetical protein
MINKKLFKTFEVDYYCPIDDTKLHPASDFGGVVTYECSLCWTWYIETDLKDLNKEELLKKYVFILDSYPPEFHEKLSKIKEYYDGQKIT